MQMKGYEEGRSNRTSYNPWDDGHERKAGSQDATQLSGVEHEVEVFLPELRIQITGPVREKSPGSFGAQCIRSASEAPGGNPQQAGGYTDLQPGGEVWSGLRAGSGLDNLDNARRCRREGGQGLPGNRMRACKISQPSSLRRNTSRKETVKNHVHGSMNASS